MLASTIQFSNTNQHPSHRATHLNQQQGSLTPEQARTLKPHPHGCCLRTQQCANHATHQNPPPQTATPTPTYTSPNRTSKTTMTTTYTSPPTTTTTSTSPTT